MEIFCIIFKIVDIYINCLRMFNLINELMLVFRISVFMENWKYFGLDKFFNFFRGLCKVLNDFLYENEFIISFLYVVL